MYKQISVLVVVVKFILFLFVYDIYAEHLSTGDDATTAYLGYFCLI